jgi:hypothetical protein
VKVFPERRCIEPGFRGELDEHVGIGDASSLNIMGALQPRDHVQSSNVQCVCGEHGRRWRFQVHDGVRAVDEDTHHADQRFSRLALRIGIVMPVVPLPHRGISIMENCGHSEVRICRSVTG